MFRIRPSVLASISLTFHEISSSTSYDMTASKWRGAILSVRHPFPFPSFVLVSSFSKVIHCIPFRRKFPTAKGNTNSAARHALRSVDSRTISRPRCIYSRHPSSHRIASQNPYSLDIAISLSIYPGFSRLPPNATWAFSPFHFCQTREMGKIGCPVLHGISHIQI